MANGKKNYFRHSFFAHQDLKLKLLRDAIGTGHYFYYFSLLELCGSEAADELKLDFEFHKSTIHSLWSVRNKKCVHICGQMNNLSLLHFEEKEKTYWFGLPKLSKYLGRYTTKNKTKSGQNLHLK